jgi:transmembrane sensor
MDVNERRRRASDEATEWWLRMQEGSMSRADREALVDWMRESAVHLAELLCIARVHGALDKFAHWERIPTEVQAGEQDGSRESSAAGAPPGNVVTLAPTPARSMQPASCPRFRGRWQLALAASLVSVMLAGGIYFAVAGQTIETARGERREVTLNDGSVVMVDPDTQLHIRIADDERRISLGRGRALFRVAPDAKRPFSVQAGKTVIRAVGTAFGVELNHDTTVITVSEGRVAVADGTLLQAGEQLTVRRSGPVGAVRHVDSSRALAWAEGRLIFDQRTIAEVVAEFNRYNRVQLSVSDPQLAQRRMSGVFNASDPESFIAFIQTMAPVSIARDEERGITIEARR